MAQSPVRGSQRLKRRLDIIRQSAADVVADRDNAIKNLLLRRNLERFDRGVDPDEVAWEPLQNATVRKKARLGYPTPERPLFATGFLRKSIGIIRGNATFAVATGAGFRIGITNPDAGYGRFHQQGSGVPQRRFLGINSKDVKAVDALIRRAIIRATKG